MSTVPMEYAWITAFVVSLIAWGLGTALQVPHTLEIGMALQIVTFVAYSYSPLPQGAHRPNHKKRKRKWGFSVEYQDGPQNTLNQYGESNGE